MGPPVELPAISPDRKMLRVIEDDPVSLKGPVSVAEPRPGTNRKKSIRRLNFVKVRVGIGAERLLVFGLGDGF